LQPGVDLFNPGNDDIRGEGHVRQTCKTASAVRL
jgi:hypothetical protein